MDPASVSSIARLFDQAIMSKKGYTSLIADGRMIVDNRGNIISFRSGINEVVGVKEAMDCHKSWTRCAKVRENAMFAVANWCIAKYTKKGPLHVITDPC